MEGRTDYDLTEGRAKGANVFLALSDPRTFTDDFSIEGLRGRSRVSFGYRYVANSALQEVNGGLLLRLTKRYYGAFEARYDGLSKKFLEVGGGIRVISDCECWVIDIGLSNRINPNETQARALLEGAVSSFHMEKRYVHHSGELVWVMLSRVPAVIRIAASPARTGA